MGRTGCLPFTPERDDELAAALLALGVDAAVVVALVHRARLGLVAASVERVEERYDEVRLLPPRRFDPPRERKAGRSADEYGLSPLRVRGLARVQLHADLTMLARLSQAPRASASRTARGVGF
jgi:hypothetical protein